MHRRVHIGGNHMKLLNYMIIVLGLMTASAFSHAGVVKKVANKGNKKLVLIQLEGESVKKKDILLVEKNGRPMGLVYVMKAKPNMAYGVLAKGKVVVGATTRPYKKKSAKAGTKKQDRTQQKGTFKNFIFGDDVFYSVMFGSAMNTMTVKDTNGNKTDVEGSGVNFKFSYDYPLLESIWVRASIGYHDFAGEGPEGVECGSGSSSALCQSTIKYLVMDLTGRLMLWTGDYRPWVGVILGAYVPLSQDETTAVKQESVTNTSTYGVALGFDWRINKNWMIPLQAEYNLFPASPNVTANTITYRLGVGYSF